MHIFLTGPKGVGKSTLVNRISEAFPGRIGGFRTMRLNTWLPGQYTVHLFQAQEVQVPSGENLLFACKGHPQDLSARFAELGCPALTPREDTSLLLMDELGPHEGESAVFQEAVWKAIEGKIPVLGVLQEADSPFLKQIAAQPNVYLLTVTAENRDMLARQLPAWIDILTKSTEGGLP